VTVLDEVEQVRPPLVSALEGMFLDLRPDLAVSSAARVRDQLGLARYRAILAEYQQTGSIGDGSRGELAKALRNQARFLIAARVEKDAVHLAAQGSLHLSNRTGTSGSVGVGATSRSTKVRVALYDLERGRDVQSAVYSSSSSAGISRPVPPPPLERVVLRPNEADTPRIDPPTDIPALVDAVLEAFRDFAHDLPGPVLPPSGNDRGRAGPAFKSWRGDGQ